MYRPAIRTAVAALASAIMTASCLAQGVEVEGLRQDFKACRHVDDAGVRLKCYDALQAKLEKPNFQGWHAEETPPFTVVKPTLLRYQSDGPIFVMYLKDEKGEVVQNLHIGGGGESTFLITKPGIYNLQVSGTDTWRIWIEPQSSRTRRMADHRRVAMILLAALCAALTSAQARVQSYQIVRLLTFRTECQIDKVEERPASGGALRFFATCENVSFYPDGVEVICADHDDDRSCQVTTRAKNFDDLHLLDPRR